jgi:hypothetical protein
MDSTFKGILGLGVTLFVLAAGMATVNGLVRGYAASRLASNPNDENARGLLLLF